MSKTDSKKNTVEWKQLDWRKIQKAVWKLQKRIYRAYAKGDVRQGRRLQKTLFNQIRYKSKFVLDADRLSRTCGDKSTLYKQTS